MKDPVLIGIYKIENIVNGKVYIGRSIDIYRRWDQHANRALSGIPTDKPLYLAMKKYGYDKFYYTIIEILEEKDLIKLALLENYYIKLYDSLITTGKGYNLKYEEIPEKKVIESPNVREQATNTRRLNQMKKLGKGFKVINGDKIQYFASPLELANNTKISYNTIIAFIKGRNTNIPDGMVVTVPIEEVINNRSDLIKFLSEYEVKDYLNACKSTQPIPVSELFRMNKYPYYYNNGKEEVRAMSSPGSEWKSGRLQQWKSQAKKGESLPGEKRKRPYYGTIYNNGIINKYFTEIPSNEWVLGKLQKKKDSYLD